VVKQEMRGLRDFCGAGVTIETARPLPHLLDFSLRWNDGAFYFCFY